MWDDEGWGTCPSCWPGPGVGSSRGMVLVLPPGWPLGGLGGVLGPASPSLRGSPWSPRGAVSALAGSGWTCHSLPWIRVRLFLLPVGGNGSVGAAAGTPTNSSS